jgi:hypothetical protein
LVDAEYANEYTPDMAGVPLEKRCSRGRVPRTERGDERFIALRHW